MANSKSKKPAARADRAIFPSAGPTVAPTETEPTETRLTAIERSAESVPQSTVEAQLQAVWAISEVMADAVGFDELIERVVPLISESLGAERSTLFLLDAETGELWSRVAQGEKTAKIHLLRGQGLAGWVAEHEHPLRVDDAYDDDRFNPEVDRRTGFKTRSVIAVPVRNRARQLIGVIQVLNRIDGVFSSDDIRLLDAIATQTAYAIENAQLSEELLEQNRQLEAARRRAEHRRAELDLLYQLEKESSDSDELDEMLDTMIVRVCERLKSKGGSILLTEDSTGRLLFRGVSGPKSSMLRDVSLQPGEGIAGWVAEHGEPVIVNAPEDDPRHEQKLAHELQVPARAILAVPLVWDRRIIGAVEVLNPISDDASDGGEYTLEDLKVLTVIAGQIARAASSAQERRAKRETERLAIMGRMLAGVAHDLRTPMTVISGYAQLVAMDRSGDSRRTRCNSILRQVDEMTAMIGDLLSFARGDSRLRASQVNVRQLAEEIRENLQEHCDAREVLFEMNAVDGLAIIDAGRARRIVFNLAKNALDVLTAGQTLAVRIHARDYGLAIQVSDTGPGIPEHITHSLFEPFVSDGKEDGTGLGLSIVKRFVEDHDGTISVDSRTGEGTTFDVFLAPAPRIQPSMPMGRDHG